MPRSCRVQWFNSSFRALLDVLGNEIVWEQPKADWLEREEKLKDKNVFEACGNSPTATATVRVSTSGCSRSNRTGLEEKKRRIMDAFEKIRHPVKHSEPPLAQQTPQPPQAYTEEHETRFHHKAKRLSLAALCSSHIMMTAPCNNVWTIEAPSQSA
jgi:hypothetical protein